MVELSPSILSCNFYNLEEDIKKLKDTPVKMLHVDVMDGIFVPNISFGFKVIKDLGSFTDYFLDTHLMIERPERYIKDFKKAGCDRITFHYEACEDVGKTIDLIKSEGMEVGLTFKPRTDINLILPYLDRLDLILIMSVEPGFGGQSFMEESIEKIRLIRDLIDQNKQGIILQVDGGIKTSNVRKVIQAGASNIVSGSDIFGQDIKNQANKYYEIFKEESL